MLNKYVASREAVDRFLGTRAASPDFSSGGFSFQVLGGEATPKLSLCDTLRRLWAFPGISSRPFGNPWCSSGPSTTVSYHPLIAVLPINIMKLMLRPSLLLAFVFLLHFQAMAKVSMPSVFSDNMVLQQKTKAAFWGTTQPNNKVVVSTSWNNLKYTAIASNTGQWKVSVHTPSFGGPYTVIVNDGEPIEFHNVLIGGVWVCSGQSNMEMPLAGWGKVKNYEQEIATANYPNIRLLQVVQTTSNQPMQNVAVANNGWTPCTPEYVTNFSSVAYFFAREIYNKTKIPIGLIHASWGGTIAEAWTSATTLKTMADFREAVSEIEKTNEGEGKNMYETKMSAWTKLVNEKDAGMQNGQPQWQKLGLQTDGWKSMTLPTLWENAGLPNFDGIVWFRKKISLPASWAGRDVQLSLGEIDDNETTWFNGEQIGATEGYNRPRKYTIKGNLVKVGENEITVRVFDGGGGGGLYGDAKLMTLTGADGQSLSLAGNWVYNVGVDFATLPPKPTEIAGPNRPSVLYNAMINPFVPYAIKGVIWYQGEANADRALQYKSLFPALIKDWRSKWGQGNFPFYFVQLANYMDQTKGPETSAWAELRDAQLQTLSLPNTGMAVAIDIGDAKDIHPKNKQEVGRRLALIALAKAYGKKVVYSGPIFKTFKVAGQQMVLDFAFAEGGLKITSGTSLTGFEIAGNNQMFYPATAIIKAGQVFVNNPNVPAPVAVRYNWANNPIGNLSNSAGLPASPFRTGKWEGIVVGKR